MKKYPALWSLLLVTQILDIVLQTGRQGLSLCTILPDTGPLFHLPKFFNRSPVTNAVLTYLVVYIIIYDQPVFLVNVMFT